ncbi:hypothetical protein H9Q72_009493 [Fusarium xylarioides]|uniref:Uncharacterized protein n=1 Tax=Fusarium xylarioides TaxID=221167 RepID=A0A9P7HUI1_9HYPO|nr:hypothetical protein H9Q70_008593 [Fusarium xylarioides]KAG5762393.1 hypothetical protein H9Q72_009493 [Fusarium xylarioides]KAG5776909.1 hypothetical protein H9Q73_009438 [Fusarium xylarioides]
MGGSYLSSYPGFAEKFQGEMDRCLQKAEYNSPIMKRAIFTLKENFAKVTKNMSVSLANNLAGFVRHELGLLSPNAAIDISICPAYGDLGLADGKISYPAWFFLASVYGPDHPSLRRYRDQLSLSWGVSFPADQVIYPDNKSVEEQEILFAIERNDDKSKFLAEQLARFRTSEFTPLNRTLECSNIENRLANVEADFLVIRSQLKLQSELIEEGIKAIREMAKSLKAEKEQTELSRKEAEVEIAYYELVARGVNSGDGAAEDEVD